MGGVGVLNCRDHCIPILTTQAYIICSTTYIVILWNQHSIVPYTKHVNFLKETGICTCCKFTLSCVSACSYLFLLSYMFKFLYISYLASSIQMILSSTLSLSKLLQTHAINLRKGQLPGVVVCSIPRGPC